MVIVIIRLLLLLTAHHHIKCNLVPYVVADLLVYKC